MPVKAIALLMVSSGLLTAEQSPVSLSDAAKARTLEKEAALGRQLAKDFRQQYGQLNTPVIQRYLQDLTQRISVHVPDAEFPFNVSAIHGDPCSATHEPVALPGGYVFVPAALFLTAEKEAEMAGLLAQAMERIVLHAGVYHVPRGGAAQLASIPLTFFGGGCTAAQRVPVAERRSTGELVLAADRGAVQIMARAGFNPVALVHYIERVQSEDADIAYTALPTRTERIAAMQMAIKNLPKLKYSAQDHAFNSIQKEVRRLSDNAIASRTIPTLKRGGNQ